MNATGTCCGSRGSAPPEIPEATGANRPGDSLEGSDHAAASATAAAIACAESAPQSPASQQQHPSEPVAEIEIKLLCEPEVLEAVLGSAALDRFTSDNFDQKQLDAVYFDTPDAALLKRKWTLRVRRDERDQHTMTLKTPGVDDSTGAIARSEWNAPVAGTELDQHTLAGWLERLRGDDVQAGDLRPVFRTIVNRRTRRITTTHGIIELAADRGVVAAGGHERPISEIELELVSGSPAAVFEVARALLETLPLRPAVRSKAARGYDAALGHAPEAVKAGRIPAAGDARLDDALHKAFQSIFSHAMANLAAAESGSSPEGVHQLRVALRRLRSLLGVVDAIVPSQACSSLRIEAKWLMSELGHARNWDVFTGGTMREAREACLSQVDFGLLDERVAHFRTQAQQQAREALHAPRAGKFLMSLGGWISSRGWRDGASGETLAQLLEPADHVARQILRQRYRKVRKKGRGFQRLDAASLHETRLALKKLRYIVEVFQPFLASSHGERRFTRKLAELQNAFGHYNDLHAALAMLHQLRTTRSRKATELAIGAVFGWQASEERAAITILRKQWKKFCAIPKPGD